MRTHAYVKVGHVHREAAREFMTKIADCADEGSKWTSEDDKRQLSEELAESFADAEERGWSHLSEARTKLIDELETVLLGERDPGAARPTGAELLAKARELVEKLDRIEQDSLEQHLFGDDR